MVTNALDPDFLPAALGRRPKFTPATIDKLCEHLKFGHFVKTACQLVGIAENTYYHWKRTAEKAKHPSRLQRYFLQSIARAEAEGIDFHVKSLHKGAINDWRASAFYLERRRPDMWARKEFQGQLDRDGKPTDPVAPTTTTVERVLVVPAQITDIHEWSKHAKAVDGKVRKKEAVLLEHKPDDSAGQ